MSVSVYKYMDRRIDGRDHGMNGGILMTYERTGGWNGMGDWAGGYQLIAR